MALTWDITNCVDSAELTTDETWSATEEMIFATMAVGLPGVSEANADTFYARLRTWQRLIGVPAEEQVTPEKVRRYVGLRTNVSADTDAAWRKRIIDRQLDDERFVYRKSVEQDAPGDPKPLARPRATSKRR